MRPRAFVTALAIALPLVAAPVARAQNDDDRAERRNSQSRETMRFQGMDRNHDGVITRREWRGSDASFRVHDWNGDNVLSGDEVRVGAVRTPNTDEDYTPSRRPAFYDWTQAGFNRVDTNGDGRISRDEWRYDGESFRHADRNGDDVLSRAEFVNGDTDTDLEDRFEYLDANNDGRIERSEWHSSLDTFRWLDRNQDGVLSRREVAGNESTRQSDQFRNIDVNGDGRVTRDEWQWSRRSFDRYDRNGDGVLSRAELASADPGNTAVGTSGSNEVEVLLPSNQRWYDTGIDVRSGDIIDFRANGTIRMSDNGNDSASPSGAWTGRHADNAPFRDKPAGALIGRIGSGGPIFMGDSGRVNAATTGRLYLSVNDDYLQDNTGEYRVTVVVRR
jgi:Ca2+-binding EF-hand superfamily protein